jgi:hypothetical protein
MAWTAPMTAVAGSIFTAAQFNTNIRDNLNETAPAKATTAGSIFVATGTNAIAERIPTGAFETASETTTSSSYTDLATVGPTVTVTTGSKAIVLIGGRLFNNTVGQNTYASYDISGATSSSATDDRAHMMTMPATSSSMQAVNAILQDSLTPGSNTFTMKYRVTGGTGTADNRRLLVIPL